jgi:hypothetical protein
MYTYPAHPLWPMPSPSDGALTIFWDNQHEAGVLCMDNGGNIRGIHTASTLPHSRNRQHSPSQPHTASLRTPSHQSQVRLMHGIPWGWGGTCRGGCITDQITDQYAPYCSELGYAVSSEYRELADYWWM